MPALLPPGGGVAEVTRTRLNAILASLMGAVSVVASGAKADGVTDDRAAIQKAIDDAVEAGVPVFFPAGTYLVKAVDSVVFQYGNTILNVYRALNINVSNLTIIGEGAIIKFIGVNHGGINYLFATDKNLNVTDQTNIVVKGLTLDFNPTGDSSTNKRSFYFGGVEGVFLDDLFLKSSGARSGATITFQQCRTTRVTRLRAKNITQGMNLSYVTDVVWDDLQFDNFSEAIDCDRVVDQLVATNLTFRNGGPANQCIDLNSVTNAHISGITAFNVGNVFIINYKDTTLPTYAEYLAYVPWAASTAYLVGATITNDTGKKYVCTQAGTSASSGGPIGTGTGITDGTAKWDYQSTYAFTPSRNVTIDGVKGDTIALTAGGQAAFNIYSWYVTDLCEDITVQNVELTNCNGCGLAYLIKDLVLENIHLQGVATPVSNQAAITVSSRDAAGTDRSSTDLSATLRNVTVEDVIGSGAGIRVSGIARCDIDGSRVERDGSSAVNYYEFVNLDMSAMQLTLKRTRAVNSGASANTGTSFWKFTGTGSDIANYKIVWGPGHSIAGPSPSFPFAFNGNTAKRVEPNRRAHVGSLDVTTGKTHYIPIAATDTEKAYVAYASMSLFATVAADGTNFVNWATRALISGVDTGVSSGSDTAGLTAGTKMDLGNNVAKAAAILGPGDSYYAKFSNAGTGRTYAGLSILAAVMDYAVN